MRINGHAHIFSLQSALSRHAITVMVNRIRARGVPSFVADAVERLLVDQLARPEHLVEEELLGRFLDAIGKNAEFKRFAATVADLPVEVRLLDGGLRTLEISALRATLDRLSSRFDRGSTSETTIADIFETLRAAMRPDIPSIAAELIDPLGVETGIVALMMDITTEETAPADRKLFLSQLKGTSDAAVAFPGRVFPFMAVNGRRPDHFDLMRRGIEELGCVGVKLYPSLGARIDTPEMMRVYDYCLVEDVPILLHCTRTGFFESAEATENGNPASWRAILQERPGLRVCFAHAGGTGQGILSPGGPQPEQWPHTIASLIREFPQVYTDLAYHIEQMVSPETEALYLGWLREMLADPIVGDRVIFGTDAWLLRLSLPDAHYWQWFTTKLTPEEFARIAEEAPRRFLGLPDARGNGMRPNIARLVDFLTSQPSVGMEPASWLKTVTSSAFSISRSNPQWTPNNHAHVLTHAFFRRFMTDPQKKLSFDEAGSLRLRQLTYWNKEHVSSKVFEKDCRAVALALASLASGSGGSFEGQIDTNAAVARLATLAADGEKTIRHAGGTVDAIFRFSTESV